MNLPFTQTKTLAGLSAVLTLALAACGGGGGDSTATSPPPPPPTSGNSAPSISGSPPTAWVEGQVYTFVPTAMDVDNDPLTFSISNLPGWMSFNDSTGALSGVPTTTNLGMHDGISIEVSDGQASATLATFGIEVSAIGSAALTLSWTPPTTNADNSQLDDLAGYRIRWGTQSGELPNVRDVDSPGISMFVVENLAPSISYTFTVAAMDLANNESAPSGEASGIAQ